MGGRVGVGEARREGRRRRVRTGGTEREKRGEGGERRAEGSGGREEDINNIKRDKSQDAQQEC